MPSKALGELRSGLLEISALQRSNPTPIEGGGLTKPEITRAIGRAEVVLLSSHFERYLYAVNEECVDFLVSTGTHVNRLPPTIRLLHSRAPIEDLAAAGWEKRSEKLRQYTAQEAGLWADDVPIAYLDPDRLLAWMKAPNCRSVKRFFGQWTIPDIFREVTRTETHRSRLWLKIEELVEKRNNIAHGDYSVSATHLDVMGYQRAVRELCERSDNRLARRLPKIAGTTGLAW